MSLANKCSRRLFLASIPGVCVAATIGKGSLLPSSVFRYADPTTEFPVFRLTHPQHTSALPPHYARAISRKGNFLLYSSDESGTAQAYRLDLKTGQSRLLTDAENFAPACFTLLADERSFCYVDGGRLYLSGLASLRPRQVYQAPEGYQPTGLSVTDDGLSAALVERKGSHYRLQWIRMMDGMAVTLVEADQENDELNDPAPRPRRASVLYRRAGGVWLANVDGKQNYRLRLADGQALSATWTPDGKDVLYLNVPSDPHKLRNIRQFTPDTNEDKPISDTTQYACFERNADGSVFVGASGSQASPHVLLLVRAVRREFTLCEHRSSDPAKVSPIFSPDSRNVFFASDQHGKPAIYRITVDKLVEATEETPAAPERTSEHK
ncbi:MAG: oligogalacturonate lyase family protein [Acidobacteriia bacterium]|nr:oligogalacturonate lyase family protein [Terriglobia bacterium]